MSTVSITPKINYYDLAINTAGYFASLSQIVGKVRIILATSLFVVSLTRFINSSDKSRDIKYHATCTAIYILPKLGRGYLEMNNMYLSIRISLDIVHVMMGWIKNYMEIVNENLFQLGLTQKCIQMSNKWILMCDCIYHYVGYQNTITNLNTFGYIFLD